MRDTQDHSDARAFPGAGRPRHTAMQFFFEAFTKLQYSGLIITWVNAARGTSDAGRAV